LFNFADTDTLAQLNEDGKDTQPMLSPTTLAREAMLAMIAGAETTSTALSNALFYLTTHPYKFQRLRAELDAAAGPAASLSTLIESDKLAGLPYLQAIINEVLRLQPAIPNGVQRMAPQVSGYINVAGQ
jgi:cytochrome P450